MNVRKNGIIDYFIIKLLYYQDFNKNYRTIYELLGNDFLQFVFVFIAITCRGSNLFSIYSNKVSYIILINFAFFFDREYFSEPVNDFIDSLIFGSVYLILRKKLTK
jgi:hypothetical protein